MILARTTCLFLATCLVSSTHFASALPAFPGAQGFGTDTPGGRGGEVYVVDSLADSGTGTLRAALEDRNTVNGAVVPRVVVFTTGGIITLKDRILIDEPYVTVAGQTAPGDGIGLEREDPIGGNPQESYTGGLLVVKTHDVVLRHLRLRPAGPLDVTNPGVGLDDYEETKGLVLKNGASNVVVDHCSFSWGSDGQFETEGDARDATIQWSILTEGIGEFPNGASQNDPGQGMTAFDDSQRVSVHHNLFAHNQIRNPNIGSQGVWQLVNNVIYNGVNQIISFDLGTNEIQGNVIGNRALVGPDASDPAVELLRFWEQPSGPGFAFYLDDNVGPGTDADSYRCFVQGGGGSCTGSNIVTSPHPTPFVTATSPIYDAGDELLWDAIETAVGASDPRDDIDDCVVGHVNERILDPDNDDPADVGELVEAADEGCGTGGWTLAAGTPPADDDDDGMPNSFEDPHGDLDPIADLDGDGYTNIEEYANGTDVDVAEFSSDDETSDAGEDGFVRESAESSNVGGLADSNEANGNALRVGDDALDREYVSIVSFDTSGLPDSAEIVHATLSLRVGPGAGTAPDLEDVVLDIASGGFGAAALASGDFEAAADATDVAHEPETVGTHFREWDLDPVGLAFVSTTGTTQIRLRLPQGDDGDGVTDYVGFYSSDYSNSAKHPKLTVHYVD